MALLQLFQRSTTVLVWLLGLALLAAVSWVGLNRPVTSVLIEGALNDAEREAVSAVVAPTVQQGLLRVDLNSVVAQVKTLSWPQQVNVRRVWPQQLVVGVVKQQVVARWNDTGYLTSTGQLVRLEEQLDDTANALRGSAPLPQLHSISSAPEVALEIYQRLAAVSARRGANMLAMRENALGEWQVTLSPAVAVRLGRADSVAPLVERLQRFFTVREQVPDTEQRTLRYADARYANGVALAWRELEKIALQPNQPQQDAQL